MAEARVLTPGLMAEGGEREVRWAMRASDAFQKLVEDANVLREAVGPLYAEKVCALVPSPDQIQEEATDRVEAALGRNYDDVNPRRIRRGIDLSGDWEPGRRMLAGKKDDDWEAPLPSERIEDLRATVAGVLADYDAVFHCPGFVNLLRQAAIMARYQAVEAVEVGTVADVKAAALSERREAQRTLERPFFRGREEYQADADRPLEDREHAIRKRQRSMLDQARRYGALAESLDTFLLKAAKVMGVEPPARLVRMEENDGVIVLRQSDDRPGDRALLVYPDSREGAYADAVYVTALDVDRMAADGIPPLEVVRAAPWGAGTNFRNFEDLVVSLREPEMQQRVFGCFVAIDNFERIAILPRP